MLRDNIIIELY